MNGKKWVKIWIIMVMIVPIIGGFNYLIDPYGENYYFDHCNRFFNFNCYFWQISFASGATVN